MVDFPGLKREGVTIKDMTKFNLAMIERGASRMTGPRAESIFIMDFGHMPGKDLVLGVCLLV